MKYGVLDIESSIKNTGDFSIGNFRASPYHPDNQIVALGYKEYGSSCRTLYYTDHDINCFSVGGDVLLVGQNIKFDLLYLMREPHWREWLKTGKIWDCFPPEVEILTSNGFYRFDELPRDLPVAQYHENGTVDYTVPLAYIEKEVDEDLIRIHKDRHIDHISTKTHQRLLRTYKYDKLRLVDADSVASKYQHHKAVCAGMHEAGWDMYTDTEIQLMVALQADAWIQKGKYAQFEFSKLRKVDRLVNILEALKLKYTKSVRTRSGKETYRIYVSDISNYVGETKHFELLSPTYMTIRQRELFLRELTYWDGSYDKRKSDSFVYYTTNENSLAVVQEIAHLTGYRTHYNRRKLQITKRDFSCQHGIKVDYVPYKGKVYCVTVPTNKIIIRYNNKVQVTGNCALAEFVLSGQSHQYPNLNDLALKYGGFLKPDKIKEYWDNGIDTEDIPKTELLDYLEGDVINTETVFLGQIKEARARGLFPLLLMEMESLVATTEMEWNGLYFDKSNAKTKEKELIVQLQDLESELIEEMKNYLMEMPIDDISPSSNDQLSVVLFGGTYKYEDREDVMDTETGEPYRYKTGKKKGQIKTRKCVREATTKGFGRKPREEWTTKKTGIYQTNEDVLKKVGTPFTKTVLEYRGLAKDINTYYVGYSNLVWPDGCIHGKIDHVRVPTGRFNSSQPNLMNLSNKK